MNEFVFSNAYCDASVELADIQRKMKYADKLQNFLLSAMHDEAVLALEESKIELANNTDKLFKVCEHFGIPRIFIGRTELVTDLPRTPIKKSIIRNHNTLIWEVKRTVAPGTKFAAGCGNGNQTQTQNSELYLEKQYLDKAWDVKTRTEISIDSFRQFMVVSRSVKWKVEEHA